MPLLTAPIALIFLQGLDSRLLPRSVVTAPILFTGAQIADSPPDALERESGEDAPQAA